MIQRCHTIQQTGKSCVHREIFLLFKDPHHPHCCLSVILFKKLCSEGTVALTNCAFVGMSERQTEAPTGTAAATLALLL